MITRATKSKGISWGEGFWEIGLGERFRACGLQRKCPGRNGIIVMNDMRELRQEAEMGEIGTGLRDSFR